MRYLVCRTYFLYQLYFDDTVNSRVCCERNIKNNLDFLQSKSLLFLTAIFLPSVFCFIPQRAHRVKNVEKCSIIPKPYNKAIMQKGESQNGCFKKNKTRQIFRKTSVSYPLIRIFCAYQGVRNVRFSENLAYFVFSWNTLFEIRLFALLPS